MTIGSYTFCTDPTATQIIEVDNTGRPVLTVNGASSAGVEGVFVWGGFQQGRQTDVLFKGCRSCWLAGTKAIVIEFLGDSAARRHQL